MFSSATRVRSDFERLSHRMAQRLYPETSQALALYWLKTLWKKGYARDEWRILGNLLEEPSSGQFEPECRQALADLRTWVHRAIVQGRQNEFHPPAPQSHRRPPDDETLRPYLVRLLNEWLPAEIAGLLVEDIETDGAPANGIPAIAVGRALERLLLREHLTAVTLEAMLQPGLMSPLMIYPADHEILRDVVLYLLGRTEAPSAPVLPATLMFIAPDVHFSSDYSETVARAAFVHTSPKEELHVPITHAEAMATLAGDPVHITSRIATIDGRWWEAGKLRSGEQNVIVYQPAGRIRIDNSADHSRIRMPWPEARYHWPGPANLGPPISIFGREWHVGRWEQDADHTWVDLVFTRWLAFDEMGLQAGPRRAVPAYVDLAWAALEEALAVCVHEKRPDAIDRLRREEMIPLGRALLALAEAALDAPLRQPTSVESRVKAVGFFAAAVRSSYGPVRWRVLPAAIRRILLGPRLYPMLSESLHENFEGVPEAPGRIEPPGPARWLRRAAS